jgi:hypothetical protein
VSVFEIGVFLVGGGSYTRIITSVTDQTEQG